MAGGVVQVAGNPGALLSHREQTFLLGLVFGADNALLQLGDALSTQPGSLAGEPRDGPRKPAMNEVDSGEAFLGRRRRGQERSEQRDHYPGGAGGPRTGLVPAGREQIE